MVPPAPETLAASLKQLGLPYVDLFLIHHPFTTAPGTQPDPAEEATLLRKIHLIYTSKCSIQRAKKMTSTERHVLLACVVFL
ncbi:hypothetical protein VUR80DRAFT_1398 [Thermomyces stellatus]